MSLEIQILEPGIPPNLEKMVAEILACADPDPTKRTEHRRSKLATFPPDDQETVREITNRVIKARNSNANATGARA